MGIGRSLGRIKHRYALFFVADSDPIDIYLILELVLFYPGRIMSRTSGPGCPSLSSGLAPCYAGYIILVLNLLYSA
jgi:hypothetical protein